MVSACPSLIQVTVVAGEPVEMQVKLLAVGSNSKLEIVGRAGKI